jgi:3-oxoacyl-[acyl-carrier protein] reductase
MTMTFEGSPGAGGPVALVTGVARLGVTANVINPGPVDTGWMDDPLRQSVHRQTPLGRLGTPRDTARLVDFLCSPEGGWINGQLLMSNGGFS